MNPWIDVSVPLVANMVHWPGDPPFRSDLALSLDRGDACNLTQLSTSAHIGTHMDAPRHFLANGLSIDQMPVEAGVGPCRVLEIQHPEAILPAELRPHDLRAGERILFKTRNSTHAWSSPEFAEDFVYISKEAASFLVERGVQTVGVDYLSVGGYFKDGVATHQILLGAPIWVIEGLDLSAVQPGRYEMICLPIRLQGSDGAPARVILRAL